MLRILHLEDRQDDAFLIKQILGENGIEADINLATNRSEFVSALERDDFDLILADNALPGFSGLDALKLARQKCPQAAVICVSGNLSETQATACMQAGAAAKRDAPSAARGIRHGFIGGLLGACAPAAG